LLRQGVQSAKGDARLLEKYLDDRDESAFETLVERHGPMVLSLCRRYLRDPRDVEDAFQATFLVLVRKGASLRDKASLSSWLYGVAYRVALRARSDVLKRRTREGTPDELSEAVAPPARQADDMLEILDAELSRLAEKYRAPLVLCYLEGRTHDQAAAELGWPVGTVRSRMARARAILAPRLTRQGLDASACLAVLRPEFLASSFTSTIPPSLVRAVLGGGGMASIASTSSSWPASALAQGVLTAMLISQLKWIGVGTTAFGLLAATAGVGAWAVNGQEGAEVGPRPVKESKPTETPQGAEAPAPAAHTGVRKPAYRKPTYDVQTRLAEMERKIDQLTELLQRIDANFPLSGGSHPSPERSRIETSAPVALPAAPVALPAAPVALPAAPAAPVASTAGTGTPAPVVSPSPDANRPRPALHLPSPESIQSSRGFREIELLLQALDHQMQLMKEWPPGGVPAHFSDLATEQVQVLVARLQEMEDEFQDAENGVDKIRAMLERTLEQHAILSRVREQNQEGKAKSESDLELELISRRLDQLNAEYLNAERESAERESRRRRVKRLIEWAHKHFEDVKLGGLEPAPTPG
jgi:RNA polymerase sigma factor (sigma-70 family)